MAISCNHVIGRVFVSATAHTFGVAPVPEGTTRYSAGKDSDRYSVTFIGGTEPQEPFKGNPGAVLITVGDKPYDILVEAYDGKRPPNLEIEPFAGG